MTATPTMTRDRTLCFTGHRHYIPSPADEERLAAAVQEAWCDGFRVFISGMAPGFDLAAARAVVRLRERHADVRLVAAVPFAGQAAGYPAPERACYEALLAAADEVRVLEGGYSHGCYLRRDDWMVDRSARVVCWYDPSGALRNGRGGHNGSRSSDRATVSRGAASGRGTKYTVRRALALGRGIVNVFRPPDSLF